MLATDRLFLTKTSPQQNLLKMPKFLIVLISLLFFQPSTTNLYSLLKISRSQVNTF